jgi:hypothetical protein
MMKRLLRVAISILGVFLSLTVYLAVLASSLMRRSTAAPIGLPVMWCETTGGWVRVQNVTVPVVSYCNNGSQNRPESSLARGGMHFLEIRTESRNCPAIVVLGR